MRAARITRRRLLAGAAASTVAGPAFALPPFRRGGHPTGGSRTPLAMTLTFPDGNTLSFNESAATDIGDYVGAFVHQKCLRQRASGHSDYRDAFTVHFRPDADGSRDEIVVEYGTEFIFSTVNTTPVVHASGQPPYNLFIPNAPTVNKTTGGTSGQSGTAFAYITYVNPSGESYPSASSSKALAVGELLTVTSPAAAAGATGYKVYSSFTGGTGYLQTASPVPIGTNWTCPNTGLLLSGTQAPSTSTLTAYTVEITGGNLGSPVNITVPSHWWLARWRWMSAPRPLVRNVADLVSSKAAFPYDAAYSCNAPLPPNRTWDGPMGTGGVYVGIPDPGDRPDIGFVTEWQACWMLFGGSTHETSWRANAEAAGSLTWWLRDANTNAPPDIFTYPYITWNNGAGLIKYTLVRPAPKQTASKYFVMDQAHMPALSFIPWMLTDDPYFLEGAQAEAHYAIMDNNLTAVTEGITGLISRAQPRSWGWGLRSVSRMAGFAPTSAPSWLKPRSYWQSVLANNKTYADKFLASTNPQCAVFGMIPHTNIFETFMTEFIIEPAAWMKYTGLFPEWDSIVDFIAIPRLAMSDNTGASGWDARFPIPYIIPVIDAGHGASASIATGGTYNTAPTAFTPTSWAELWNDVLPYFEIAEPLWTDPSTWAADTLQQMEKGYTQYSRNTLAALALGGNAQALSEHDWLHNQIQTVFGGDLRSFGATFKRTVAPPP